MNTEQAGLRAEMKIAVYSSSLGNYFFHEIAELIVAGLRELGLTVQRADESGGFLREFSWHLVVAPHEFFQLGAGTALDSQPWPENLVLFNTEQPSTEWFALAVKRFPRARQIWDIDFESALRIGKQGFACTYLPLGYAAASPMFETVRELPLHEGTRELSAEVRRWSEPAGDWLERPLDLLFLGHSSSRREQFFSRHAEALAQFKSYFHKSSVSRPLIPGQTTSMNTATSIGLAQRSKVLLNVHHGVDKYFEWHRIVLLGIAQRCLVVTEPCSLAPPFRANRDFVEAPLREVPERIRYHLTSRAGQAEAAAMVERAYETLTLRCRLSAILRPLLKSLVEKAVAVEPSVSLDILGTTPPAPAPQTARPLSICVVTPDMNGAGEGSEVGAAQTELAQLLAAAGHRVTLLHSQDHYGEGRSMGYWTCFCNARGIQYVPLPLNPAVPIDASDGMARSYLIWEWLRQRQFQVVHFPDTAGNAFYSILGKRQGLGLERTLLCVHAQGPEVWRRSTAGDFLRHLGELENDFLERESVGAADVLFAPSSVMMSWLEEQKWTLPTHRFVQPNLLPRGAAPVISPETRRVQELIFVGSLDVAGGLEVFCDALDKVPAALLQSVEITCLGRDGAVQGRRCEPYLQQRGRSWPNSPRVVKSPGADRFAAALKRPGAVVVMPAPAGNLSAVRYCLAQHVPFLVRATGGTREVIAPADGARACFDGTVAGLTGALSSLLNEGASPARPAVEATESERQWLRWHESVELPAASEPAVAPADALARAKVALPLVSVCLVHFNRPHYLKQALESLRAQDYARFEVVLVDDGSTDPAALTLLAELEPDFRQRGWQLIRQSNRYLGAARNTAARHAQGEYLLFMDDDNYAKPQELSTFVRVAQKTGADILTSAMDLFTGVEAPGPKSLKARWLFLGPAAAVGAFRNLFGDANALVRREVFERLGGFSEDYGITHEDWEFHARAVLSGCRMETIPEALFWYRYTPGSMIHHTPKFANHQRSLRPYVEAAPAALQELVRFSQGMKIQLDEFSGQVGNYEYTGRLLKGFLAAGRLLAETGQRDAADNVFMEALKACEQIGNFTLQFEGLLLTAKNLAELNRREMALKLAERALKIAQRIRDEGCLQAARTLLGAIRQGQDIATACAGMRFLDVDEGTTFTAKSPGPARPSTPPVSAENVPFPVREGMRPDAAAALPGRVDRSRPSEVEEPFLQAESAPSQTPLRIGILSAEEPGLACPHIRLHSVLARLRERGEIELVELGQLREGKFALDGVGLAQVEVIVVQRQMAALLPHHELRRRLLPNTKIVFEIDDALTHLPSWHRAHAAYERIRPQLEEYLRGADLVTVSTPALAELYASFNSRIAVLPNYIDERLWAQPSPEPGEGPVKILFSGTLDHGRDLQMIEEPLLRLLAAFPGRVEFVYWGNITERLRAHPAVKAGPAFTADYRAYAAQLQGLDVAFAVVPLENNSFNGAKSAIKWLEYGACGIPAIFSDLEPYARHVAPGENGLLVANTAEAWFAAMELLVNDAGKRRRLGQEARRIVLAEHTVAEQSGRWLAAYESLRAAESAETSRIDVSIIIPVFNRLDLTRKCLAALTRHTPVGRYEVIAVDNGSTDGTQEFLAAARKSGSLQALAQTENLGFARACNLGAKAAQGSHLLFLNNDTEVTAGWLEPLLQLLEADPSVAAVGSKLVFPDGTIQHAGVALGELPQRDPLLAVHVHYKQPSDFPGANERMVFQALTAACLLVRRENFEAVDGFDEGYWNGYEDVDLCLQFQQRGWRCVYEPASVVVHHESQSGPARFQRVQDNIRRLHRKWLGQVSLDVVWSEGGVSSRLPTSRISAYETPRLRSDLVSIIILTHNQLPHTQKCLESIAAHTRPSHEIIVVDNGSSDGTVEYLQQAARQTPHLRLILNPTNRGFAAGNNQGMAAARGPHVLWLNNDTVVTPEWLERMLAVFVAHPEAGLVGPMSNYVSGAQLVSDPSYADLGQLDAFARDWVSRQDGQSTVVTRLVGFCLLVRSEVVARIGGLDEAFGSGNFEDDDYCLRASLAGFQARIARDVFVHHTGSQTFKGAGIDYNVSMRRNWELFKAKWGLPAEAPIERGYRTPLRLVEASALKVPLPNLGAPPSAIPARKTSPGKAKPIVLPPTARVGDLKVARDLLNAKELVPAWTATVAALQARPFHPEAFLLLAEIAWSGGDQSMAKRCVARAEKLAPKWRPARKFLKKHPARSGGARVAFPALPDPVTEPRLSVCLIVRNEEKFLPGCLKSVQGLAAQLIVVDTGSEDRTVQIATEFGAEVYSFAWDDDFSAARNAALEHATGDWVLMIDADEELLPASVEVLRAEMKASAVLAYRLRLLDAGKEAEGCHYVPRLFRNAPGLFFLGRIHEQVFSSIEVRRQEWELENRLGTTTLLHHGYTRDVVRGRDKVARNLRLLEQAVLEQPEEPNLLMNLGLELARSGRKKEGLRQYWAAVQVLSTRSDQEIVPELRETLLTQLASHLLAEHDYASITQLLTSPLAQRGTISASLHFAHGLALLENRQYSAAAEQFRACLDKRALPALTPMHREIRGAGPKHCLALCLKGLKQIEEAARVFDQALQDEPQSRPLRLDYARFLTEAGQPLPALTLLHQLVTEKPEDVEAWQKGGEIALSQVDFLEFARDWTSEALKAQPQHLLLVAQRAEALLLSEEWDAALPLWQQVGVAGGARGRAAAILCQLVAGHETSTPADDEALVSREFMQWYRQLLEWERSRTVLALNERVGELRVILPTAAEMLGAVLVAVS